LSLSFMIRTYISVKEVEQYWFLSNIVHRDGWTEMSFLVAETNQ